jgi:hypothetical protein
MLKSSMYVKIKEHQVRNRKSAMAGSNTARPLRIINHQIIN